MQDAPERYAFDDFVLEVGERRLCHNGQPVALPPLAFDVLTALVRRRGQLLTKRDLLAHVWQGTSVEDGILTVYVSLLRKALRDTGRRRRYIQTVTRYGYRFVGVMVTSARGTSASVSPAAVSGQLARGYEQLLNGSCFALDRAADAFASAIALEEKTASAHAGLALTRCAQAQGLAISPRRAYRDASSAVLRALALDVDDPDAQVALASVLLFHEWDYHGAERAVRRALQANRQQVEAYVLCGNLHDVKGDVDGALEMKMRALDAAPGSPAVLTQIAQSFWRKRDYAAAIEWTQRALRQDPSHVGARRQLALALWKIGAYRAVTAELVKQAELFGLSPESWQRAEPGERPPAPAWPDTFTRTLMARLPVAGGGPSDVNAAVASGERGETDAAFRYLDAAIARRHPAIVHLAVDPQWDALRGDSRLLDRLKHFGL